MRKFFLFAGNICLKRKKTLKHGELFEVLKALAIVPNEKTKEYGSLLAVARAEARKREHEERNPPIRALRFFPELNVYVAVYEAQRLPDSTFEQKR
jgi:hypothetical protein